MHNMIVDINHAMCFRTGKKILLVRAIQQEQTEFGFVCWVCLVGWGGGNIFIVRVA